LKRRSGGLPEQPAGFTQRALFFRLPRAKKNGRRLKDQVRGLLLLREQV
jgi:hypothetical protein